MRRRLVAVLIAAGVVLSAAGCGQGEGIGQAASDALAPQVAAVRAAAETGNRDDALAKLAVLRQSVAQLRSTGELSEEGAAKVLAAAVEVEGHLGLLPAPAPAPAPAGGSSGPATGAGVKDENQRKAEEEARKRAEEAAKKAEEEAKKRAADAKKRAEENKKDD